MRHSSGGHRQLSGLATNDVGSRVALFLRRRHPTKTVDHVAADLAAWGVGAAAISKWLERSSAPGAKAWVALIGCYGPEFLAAVMPSSPRWLDEAYRAETQRRIEAEIAALEAQREALR